MNTASAPFLWSDMKESPAPRFAGWRERASEMADVANRHGGLVPQSSLHRILGVSRVRAHDICREQKVQVVEFSGVLFVTADSIEAYKNSPPFTGRGHKLKTWEKITIPIEYGLAIADVIAPE